jgi:phage terminase large subunit-like protein
VDYAVVEEQILEDSKRFDLLQYAYDPYRAGWLVGELKKHGNALEGVEYPQRYTHMAMPTALFERAVIGKQLAHGGNPVMKWMIACTEVKSDRQGLIMPMKPKRGARGKRIDGVVASIMAYHRAFSEFGKAKGSVYEGRGVRTA